MLLARSELRVQLDHHSLLDINDGQGLTVSCVEGSVWITQSNDTRDIVITAGESFLLDKQGLALVAAPAGQATIAVRRAGRGTPSIQFDLPTEDPCLEAVAVTVPERSEKKDNVCK